jgi:hypothetical protein
MNARNQLTVTDERASAGSVASHRLGQHRISLKLAFGVLVALILGVQAIVLAIISAGAPATPPPHFRIAGMAGLVVSALATLTFARLMFERLATLRAAVDASAAAVSEANDSGKVSFQAVSDDQAAAQRFVSALEEMAEQHELGWIDKAVPVGDMGGIHAKAAEIVNDLVASHIAVKMKIVGLVTRYAKGDFSEAMERLPGKKAQITEAMDQVRALLPRPEEIATMKRVQAALDVVKTNVMIADADNVICYMNASVTAMMRDAERDLQKDLPNFRADQLISAKIDQFHKIPSHQTRMLAELRGTHNVEIVVGGRTMSLIANPIIDENGNRIGAVVEWTDRTVEVAIERETSAVVDSASKPELLVVFDR